ncbi:MAG: hypothetical protein QOF76_5342, partial [Solirubrobacteraceae bacterium]|nr:hypothetical protein [Solirubrobacteraceae bacterium]
MRRLLLLAFLVTLALPAAASARLVVGISDNHPAMLSDPLFADLGAEHVRLVVSWDAMAARAKGDNEISDRVEPYVAAADEAGAEVMVAFEHHRGAPVNCATSRQPQCRLPSVAAYRRQVAKFVAAFPQVKYVTAWNEANHKAQPTFDHPRRAGQYAKAADGVCRAAGTCRVVAMDLLDSANDPKAPTRKLSYSRTTRYIGKLRRAYGRRPAICGIHNYADVNRFRTAGTKALARAMRCRSIWLTETGGIYHFASFWNRAMRRQAHCASATACQAKALRFLFEKTVTAARHIDRAYVYAFYSGTDREHDYGLVEGDGNAPGG